jgi:hypothetical protein
MFATSQIREQMEVVGSDGAHVGTVDHMEGEDRIKLARRDTDDARHHYLATHLVNRVDDKVHLKIPADLAKVEFH